MSAINTTPEAILSAALFFKFAGREEASIALAIKLSEPTLQLEL